MGLDAMVFCDCVEKGRLTVPHPYPRLLYIDSNGCPEIRSKDPGKIDEHDKWMNLPPCEHEAMQFAGCWLGNVGYVDRLRSVLSGALRRNGQAYPVLLRRVLYDGGHAGDWLTVREVQKLSTELDRLKRRSLPTLGPRDARHVASVTRKLSRLVRVSLATKKPIAF